uniref:Uncharacterized protein n=1 Tax=Anguilla anguilla TaxID=7936 RepID=A0A0E9XH24_ANGAN
MLPVISSSHGLPWVLSLPQYRDSAVHTSAGVFFTANSRRFFASAETDNFVQNGRSALIR